jgi:hypothetical protein
LAAGTYNSRTLTLNALYLLNAADGTILNTIPEPTSIVFAQPVFADNHLFVATANFTASQGKLTAYIPSALKPATK